MRTTEPNYIAIEQLAPQVLQSIFGLHGLRAAGRAR
jgi:hypothetical protein